MPAFPHHEHLHLVNFTAFADASFEWSPGINAVTGTNGTGKTHLLKALYAIQSEASRRQLLTLFHFDDIFQIENAAQIVRSGNEKASLSGIWNKKQWQCDIEISFSEKSIAVGSEATVEGVSVPGMSRSVFIPAADMIGHTWGFSATYDQYRIDFDKTYRDIVSALLSPPLRDQTQIANALKPLIQALGGDVEREGERFYLKTLQGRHPMPLVAEGLRKIATLYTLLKNGYLRPGDTLFWDEPETNLNPTLMDEVVATLLALARSGVQVFLTTHSYFILTELDLQATQEDQVRFFSLYITPDGTKVETTEELATLQHNAIMEQFGSVYDREVTRATAKSRRK